jgi:hypothetical protein
MILDSGTVNQVLASHAVLMERSLGQCSAHRVMQTETDVTECDPRHARSWHPATEERFMTEFDVFIVSFCVAFVVASNRFKALVAALGRLVR